MRMSDSIIRGRRPIELLGVTFLLRAASNDSAET